MKVLGIDPATSSGWAYWDGVTLISGVWDLRVRRDESMDFRLIRIREKLRNFELDVDWLFFEAAGFNRFSKAAQVAGQLEGVILVWANDNKVPWKSVKPTELKKFATGKGKAGKPAMVKAAKRLTRYTGDEHDEADARLVVAWSIRTYGNKSAEKAFDAFVKGAGDEE